MIIMQEIDLSIMLLSYQLLVARLMIAGSPEDQPSDRLHGALAVAFRSTKSARHSRRSACACSRSLVSVVVGVIASGSILRWMIAGLPDVSAALNAVGEVGGLLHRHAKAAERARIGGKVRDSSSPSPKRGRDNRAPDACGWCRKCELSQTITMIGGIELHRRREFLTVHQEIAVAGERDHGALRDRAASSPIAAGTP